MRLTMYQVDAFAERVFRGNPAAVVPLEAWIDYATMQSIAAENNLAETAFFVREPGGLRIRWFTPTTEVDLCGHATLASAAVYFEKIDRAATRVTFDSRSGPLTVVKQGDRLAMDLPSWPPEACEVPRVLIEALGRPPVEVLGSRDWFVVYATEADVRAIAPDMRALMGVERLGVIVTAPGSTVDFVSRFFAPKAGVPEDPVTGSAHCTLVPYWARRLGRTKLRARQVSPRGGDLACEQRGDRVEIAGHAVFYLEGAISV